MRRVAMNESKCAGWRGTVRRGEAHECGEARCIILILIDVGRGRRVAMVQCKYTSALVAVWRRVCKYIRLAHPRSQSADRCVHALHANKHAAAGREMRPTTLASEHSPSAVAHPIELIVEMAPRTTPRPPNLSFISGARAPISSAGRARHGVHSSLAYASNTQYIHT